MRHSLLQAQVFSLIVFLAIVLLPHTSYSQCAEIGPIFNFNGGGQVVCPCFVVGEEAGAVFSLPPNQYPLEILKVGIAWGSQFGGSGQSLEQAIHIYAAGLPNPGVPIFSLPGPLLTDGFINEFDIQFTPGNKIINSGPFTVTLEFANANAGQIFAPTVVHDGNGCQPGKNVIFAIPGGWLDACSQSLTGDWVFQINYRTLKPIAVAAPAVIQFSGVPGNQLSYETFYIRNDGCDTLMVRGIGGCDTAPFSIDSTLTEPSIAPGDSTPVTVCVMPTTSNPEMCTVSVYTNDINSPELVNVQLDMVVTGIGGDTPQIIEGISVSPNPFNPETTIRFVLPGRSAAKAQIFRVDGKLVRTLDAGRVFDAGPNTLRWNGRNDRGEPLSSGVYIVRVTSRFGRESARAVLLK